jgi:hypothetical protein
VVEGHTQVAADAPVVADGEVPAVLDGWKQSGIVLGQSAPTAQTAATRSVKTTVPTIRIFRKLRTWVYNLSWDS